MSSFPERARAMQGRVTGKLGGGATALVRRRHTLQVAGKPPAALTVSGAHVAGGSTLTLKGPGGAALTGGAPAGVTLLVAGDGQLYTLAAAAAVATNNPGAITVTVSPVLATSPGDGVVVAIVQPYAEMKRPCMRVDAEEQDLEGAVRGVRRVFNLVAAGALFTPRTGDVLVADGETHAIAAVDPGSVGGRFRVTVGDLA